VGSIGSAPEEAHATLPSQGSLTNLTPGKTYHYRLVAVNYFGIADGAYGKFTTEAASTPTVTLSGNPVTASKETLQGTVNPNGSKVESCEFVYSHLVVLPTITITVVEETKCPTAPGAGSSAVAESVAVTVKPSTAYTASLAVKYTNAAVKKATEVAATYQFETGAPTAKAAAASEITTSSAKLNAKVNLAGAAALLECKFEYAEASKTTLTEHSCELPWPTATGEPAVAFKLSGLSSGTAYKYKLVVKTATGSAVSGEETFETGGLPPATQSAGPAAGKELGFGVAISGEGTTAIAGASGGFPPMAAVVYTLAGSSWSQQTVLSGGEAKGFGASAALSENGDTALIGAPESGFEENGAALVYTRSGSTWTKQASLEEPCEFEKCDLGGSVAISGDGNTAVIGAPTAGGEVGAAWIYTRSGSTWTQGPKLTGGTEEVGKGYFGNSVAISADGNTVIVGEIGGNEPAAGAWVFTRSGEEWTQQGPMLNAGSEAIFGDSVALSSNGNTALIGALGEGNPDLKGAAYIFTRSGSTWSDAQKLTPSSQSANEVFGWSVALSAEGNAALIGASDAGGGKGAAYLFKRGATNWVLEQTLTAPQETGGGQFGYSVGLSANAKHAVVGAPYDNSKAGSAWLF
jgi:hypothetical protein